MLIKRSQRQARKATLSSALAGETARGLDRRTFLRRSGLTAGSLADRYGRRRVLLTGIFLVGAMALVVGLAPSMPLVVAARALQGCGAAAVLSAGAAVLANSTEGRQRQLAFGILGTAFGAGLAVGNRHGTARGREH